MNSILHNIVAISIIECRLLKNLIIIPGQGVDLNYWRPFQKLPLVGLASLEVESKVSNKSRLFTQTISGRLSKPLSVNNRHIALLLTAVDDSRYLVGRAEPPYSVINTIDTFPGKVTDPAGCSITVEYTDPYGLLPVIRSF